MPSAEVHRCQCPHCQQEAAHPDQALHHQMNVLLSRPDDPRTPFLCDDERPGQQLGDRLVPLPLHPGQPTRDDPAYERHGTGCVRLTLWLERP